MADIFADDFKLENDEDGHSASKEPNPFSFSNFLNTKSPDVSTKDIPTVVENTKDVGVVNDGVPPKENPYSFKNFNADNKGRKMSKKLQIIDDGDDAPFTSESKNVPTSINDPIANGSYSSDWEDVCESPKEDTTTDSEEDSQLAKIEQLVKENTALRNDLSQVREEFLEYRRTANKRVTCLQKELEKVRKKEAEETQDLESAVRMVEENLIKTTERATKAESTVARLREEINHLKVENVPKAMYDNLLLEHNQLLNKIQEKSRGVAQLMRTAAEKTEPHVKQLQSGIMSLRFFAQQFDDICKITEVEDKKNNMDDVT